MENKGKRSVIIVMFLIVLLAVIIFSLYRFKDLLSSKETLNENEQKEQIVEEDGMIIIKLTKDNWDKYFTIKTEPKLIKNDAGELEKVQYADYLILKEEYHDKISLEQRESYLDLSGVQMIEMMQYEITDAKAGEWELTKEQPEGMVVGGRDRVMLWWNSTDATEKDFYSENTFECGEYMGNLVTEVPGEPEIHAAEGELVLKNK